MVFVVFPTPDRISPRISIESLKALIEQMDGMRQKDAGIPRGGLIEVTGPARTEWVVRFLRKNPTAQIAWVEDCLSVFPTAVQQQKLALHQVVFIEAKDELDWTVTTLLRSQVFTSIVMPGGGGPGEKRLRRYQLLAEKANCSVILLSSRPSSAWCINVQLEARRGVKLKVLKQKGHSNLSEVLGL